MNLNNTITTQHLLDRSELIELINSDPVYAIDLQSVAKRMMRKVMYLTAALARPDRRVVHRCYNDS